MRLPIIVGWAIQLIGTALWVYGYFVTGHPSLINWHNITPRWIAEWLPNIEAEIGLALVLVGMVPIYWPSRQPESRLPSPASPQDGQQESADASSRAGLAEPSRWARQFAKQGPRRVKQRRQRGACGYALANAGHDTRRIQDWLGHRSIQHTTRYT